MDERKYETVNPFTGEIFYSNTPNHYEANDGIPVAPTVDTPRPTVRQRVENLLARGEDPLRNYLGTEGLDMDVPDDPEDPLTDSERNYIDHVAAELAENAPLPDEGLPRRNPELPLVPDIGQPLPTGAPPDAPQGAPERASTPPQGKSPSSP